MQQVGEAKSRVFLVTQHHSKDGELKQIYGSSLFKILSIHTSLGSAERSRTKAEDAYHELYPGYRQDGVDPLYMWLVQAMEVTAPTPPAEQQATTTEAALEGVYAELPAPNLPRGGFPDLFTEGQMRDFADRTHAKRASHGQAPAPLQRLHDLLYAAQRQTSRDAMHGAITAARIELSKLMAAPKAAPGDEGKALAALRYYMRECSGAEPSISVFHRMVEEALGAAPQQEAQKPATTPRFNCWSTNEGDSWFDHPADAQAIYDCLGNDAKVGDEYELTAGWKSVTARYRITEIVGDGEEYEVECISHQQGNTAPQPAPAPLSDDVVRDAARYRWLIDQHWIQTEVDWRFISTDQDSTIKQLDAAIDAAIAAQGGKA